MINNVVSLNQKDKIKSIKTKRFFNKFFIHAVLIIFVIIILVPFYTIFISSFKNQEEGMAAVFTWWPTQGFEMSNYKRVFESVSYRATVMSGFINTLWVVIPTVLAGLFCSAISAYAFAKLRFRAKNLMFSFLIATMMIPGIITLTPSYFIYENLGWVGTPLPLMVPGMFGSAACVFFMRQYYNSIPNELIECSKLDGLGYIKIFFGIMVPLSVPALIAQGVLGFLGGYNDYFGPLLYLTGASKLQTLQLALRNFANAYSYSKPTVLAGAFVALVPTLVLYIVAQRFFIEGISTSGMKL